MIIVTGGAGFIGSNIVKALCVKGIDDIVVVDDLTDGTKFRNIVDSPIADYLDKDDFLQRIQNGDFVGEKITAIFHQGACSETTEWNGRFMMNNNYHYSKVLLHFCLQQQIAFFYASSAAVYGLSDTFYEAPRYEQPLNVYGYSKLLFDNYVRRSVTPSDGQVVGLRYFNVYGPREQHKGTMSSVAFHLNKQLKNANVVKLFAGTDGYDNGEQRRDFIYVDDIVKINLWLLENPGVHGIFNAGTGASQTFNDVARAVIDWHQRGQIEYIPFPEHLKNCYQSFTEANISALRSAGYTDPFLTVEQGVKRYLDALNNTAARTAEALSGEMAT